MFNNVRYVFNLNKMEVSPVYNYMEIMDQLEVIPHPTKPNRYYIDGTRGSYHYMERYLDKGNLCHRILYTFKDKETAESRLLLDSTKYFIDTYGVIYGHDLDELTTLMAMHIDDDETLKAALEIAVRVLRPE